MALITFDRAAAPAASWTPTVNPNYGDGYAMMDRLHQPVDLSDGGDVYSYGKGESKNRVLGWPEMPDADLIALLGFFVTILGARYTFTFTDPDSAAFTARLVNSDGVTYRSVAGGKNVVNVELEVL